MEETSSGSPIKQQQEKIDCSTDPIPTLLPEIIEEILLRLPVKSLLKFRCVSKSWLSLISSHRFRKAHLEISTNDTDLTFHRIMFSFLAGSPNVHTYSVRSLLYEPMSDDVLYEPVGDDVSMSHPGRDLDSYFRIHGSCNGLICISIGKGEDLFLWNPTLRKSKKLPDVDDTLGTYAWKFAVFGFGFDETNDDYKVLGVFHVKRGDGPETVACIYSLKTNSWRRIEGFNIHAAGDPFIFVQGKLHWSVNTGVQNKWNIASFDLGNETYGMVEQPNYWEGKFFYPILGVLGGCICMICNSEEFRADVWVLKDFHAKESWTKFASISLSCDYTTPLCISPNGDVLFVHGSSFIVYNAKENFSTFPQIGDVFQSTIYVESLVSPDADGK